MVWYINYQQKELVLIEEDQYQLSKFSDINNSLLNEKLEEKSLKYLILKKRKMK